MLANFLALVPLLLTIVSEFFSASARKRAAGEKFTLDQSTLKALVDRAVSRQLSEMAKISAGQASGWDAADEDAKQTKKEPPRA